MGGTKETFHGIGIGENLPEIFMKKNELKEGINILELLVLSKILPSKSEIRRAINGNSIKINDELISDEKRSIDLKDLTENNLIKISYGKKKHYIIKAT